MKRIYDIIPGDLLNEDSIIDSIFSLIDSVSFDKWIEVNEDIYEEYFFDKYEEFYVMYLDPVGVVKRLYISKCEEIVAFMKERINYEHSEGVDIAVCTKQMDNAVICNHDGQVFLLIKNTK